MSEVGNSAGQNSDAGSSGAERPVLDKPPCIPQNASLDEVRAAFSRDRFATEQCGCEVLEVAFGHAVCALDIRDEHLNMGNRVMGGAIFTLADFCLGVLSNYNQPPSVSASCHIEFLASPRGQRLLATGSIDKSGRTLGFYTVVVSDDSGLEVARMQAVCARVGG
ncbi:MAG: PaaI family thioesterase [Actinomycetia bacterium]|nr:PaaI family thioesterase [Actinomycetes bacterium]